MMQWFKNIFSKFLLKIVIKLAPELMEDVVMSWIVKAISNVSIADLNLNISANGIYDLDVLGRSHAENSKDLKILFARSLLKEIKKDATSQEDNINVTEIKQAVQEVKTTTTAQNTQIENQNKIIQQVSSETEKLKLEVSKVNYKLDEVISMIRSYAEKEPVNARTIAEALKNANIELGKVNSELEEKNNPSINEISTHDRILQNKQKTLKKNIENLSATITKPDVDTQKALEALDQLPDL